MDGGSEVLDLRLLIVVGKGGVGKTTTAAALGLAAARKGKRVLLATTNRHEQLSRLLQTAPVGSENQPILPNIDAVTLVPWAALQEYGKMVLKVGVLYRAIFESRLVSSFLRGTPGIDAWATLGKVYFHATEKGADGQHRYDLVILDGPATGHAIEMFRVPFVIAGTAPPGLLRREAENAIALLRDPKRTGVVLVTLPEEMPTNEAIELHDALTSEFRFHVRETVVNRVLPGLFSDGPYDWLETLADRLPAGSVAQPFALAGRTRLKRERFQRSQITRLASAIALTPVELPELFLDELRREAVQRLSTELA